MAEAYDYREVERAVQYVIDQEGCTQEQMKAYVEQRKRELFEARFNQELQARVKEELAQAKADIEAAMIKQLEVELVLPLTERYAELERRYQQAINAAAKTEEVTETIKRREQELAQEIARTQQARTVLQKQLEEKHQRTIANLRATADEQLTHAKEMLEQKFAKAKADLEAYYAERDQQRQIKAEKSIRGSVAHGIQLMAEMVQWLELLSSPDFRKGIAWLSPEEIKSLLFQMNIIINRMVDMEHRLNQALAEPRSTLTIEAQKVEETVAG